MKCKNILWIEEEDFTCERGKNHSGSHMFTGPYYTILWKSGKAIKKRKRQDPK